jgi:hypothetical protein
LHRAARVFTDEDGSWQRQPGIFRQSDGFGAYCWNSHPDARCVQPKIGLAGPFPSPLASSFRQSAFVVRLHPPGDPFDQPCLVSGSGLVAVDVGKLCSQVFDRHSLQRSDLVCQSLKLGFTDLKLSFTDWKLGFTVIPAQAGIQIAALVSRLRGNDVR